MPISVNQSGLHISEEGYLDRMRDLLTKFELPRGAVDLEITETAFVDYTTQGSRTNATDIVRELQQMGYLISMETISARGIPQLPCCATCRWI